MMLCAFFKHRPITTLLCLFALILSFTAFYPTATKANQSEGAGLLYRDLEGALPKALWRKQPRSEIVYLLKNMPAYAPMRSIQDVKRDMLVSYYDTSLIDNDTPTNNGEDLLTLRLSKLIEMGLWEDAFSLYTKTTEDPKDNAKLAETGMLLILTQKGLSTACLEAKVLSPRFPHEDFWVQIDKICTIELGMAGDVPPEFSNSATLQAIYYNKDFNLSADNIDGLKKLTPLELALLSLKKKISYKNIDLATNTPPHLIKTFLEDSRFPSKYKPQLNDLAQRVALRPLPAFTSGERENIKNAQNISQKTLMTLISKKLRLGQEITQIEIIRGLELAPQNPQNYFYFHALNIIKPIASTAKFPKITQANLTLGLDALSTKDVQKVNFIKTLLDKPLLFSNNLGEVYEKQLSLTPDGHYVMPTGGLIKWLRMTQEHQFTGLSLLIILSNIENNAYAEDAENHSANNNFNMLRSLSTVGLIDQAHHIAREKLANLMGQ